MTKEANIILDVDRDDTKGSFYIDMMPDFSVKAGPDVLCLEDVGTITTTSITSSNVGIQRSPYWAFQASPLPYEELRSSVTSRSDEYYAAVMRSNILKTVKKQSIDFDARANEFDKKLKRTRAKIAEYKNQSDEVDTILREIEKVVMGKGSGR